MTRRKWPGFTRGDSPFRAAAFRRALWAEAHQARRLPRTAPPVTGRLRFPPYPAAAAPAPRPGRRPRARSADRREDVTAAGTERRALSRLAPPAQRGLTARARPEARPQARTANLRNSTRAPNGWGLTYSDAGVFGRSPWRALRSALVTDGYPVNGVGRKVAASPAAVNADADMVSSVTAANISPTIAMTPQVTRADHPTMADRTNTVRHGLLWRGCSFAVDSFASPGSRCSDTVVIASPPSPKLHTVEITVCIYQSERPRAAVAEPKVSTHIGASPRLRPPEVRDDKGHYLRVRDRRLCGSLLNPPEPSTDK